MSYSTTSVAAARRRVTKNTSEAENLGSSDGRPTTYGDGKERRQLTIEAAKASRAAKAALRNGDCGLLNDGYRRRILFIPQSAFRSCFTLRAPY